MQEAESLVLGSHDELPTSLDLLCRGPCPRCARLCSLGEGNSARFATLAKWYRSGLDGHHLRRLAVPDCAIGHLFGKS